MSITAHTSTAYSAHIENGVFYLTLTRPEAGNAIPSEAVPGLRDLFVEINANARVRAVLVRGEGKTFSAGGDLNRFLAAIETSPDELGADFHRRLTIVGEWVKAFVQLDVPVIAACRGGIAGAGMLFALGADVVLCDPTAKFVFAQQRLGLTPDGGISYLLPRIVGTRRASELVLTSAVVDAEEAVRLGLASRIVNAEDLDSHAEMQALRFAGSAQGAVRRAKRLIAESLAACLETQLERERDAIVASVVDADFAEGVRAAAEKRAAVFPSANEPALAD